MTNLTDSQRKKVFDYLMDRCPNFKEPFAKYLKDYNDAYVIIRLCFNAIFSKGTEYYANLSDEDIQKKVEEMNVPEEKNSEDGTFTIKLTTPELDKDMLLFKREICKKADYLEMSRFITAINLN